MSEYQYYEFQTIDRRLTDQEQSEIRKLSSRAEVSPTRASFVYNYGDFRGNPNELVEQYFDAFFYIANWGTTRVMFRFLKILINLEQIEKYCLESYIAVSEVGKYVLLDICIHDEGVGGWVEGEGWLDSLIPLRDDILRGDYRMIYLAWVKAITLEGPKTDIGEPPVPPGLHKLSSALQKFIELLGIDKHLLEVVSRESKDLPDSSITQENLQEAIGKLSRDECNTFLLQLAQGDTNLAVSLWKRLQELIAAPVTMTGLQTHRTAKDILVAAENYREQENVRETREKEAKRIQELEVLAEQENKIWEDIDLLIQQCQTKSYDEAVKLLIKLKELSIYKKNEDDFQERLQKVQKKYSNRPALKSRLENQRF